MSSPALWALLWVFFLVDLSFTLATASFSGICCCTGAGLVLCSFDFAGFTRMLSLRGGTFGGISRELDGLVGGLKVRVPPFIVLPLIVE